ncbi:hypothetical protein HDU85_006027 [Gaertneriomyces sp. JEL0708]|nr:hypothetical protein HDU85_006027 [Gaertneriomyces sp. JEL0708]
MPDKRKMQSKKVGTVECRLLEIHEGQPFELAEPALTDILQFHRRFQDPRFVPVTTVHDGIERPLVFVGGGLSDNLQHKYVGTDGMINQDFGRPLRISTGRKDGCDVSGIIVPVIDKMAKAKRTLHISHKLRRPDDNQTNLAGAEAQTCPNCEMIRIVPRSAAMTVVCLAFTVKEKDGRNTLTAEEGVDTFFANVTPGSNLFERFITYAEYHLIGRQRQVSSLLSLYLQKSRQPALISHCDSIKRFGLCHEGDLWQNVGSPVISILGYAAKRDVAGRVKRLRHTGDCTPPADHASGAAKGAAVDQSDGMDAPVDSSN